MDRKLVTQLLKGVLKQIYNCKFPLNFMVFFSGMVPVNSCPKNKLDTIKASETLKCGKDKYNNNQYMCLPNKKKSSLMEFCFNGVIGAEEKGMLF